MEVEYALVVGCRQVLGQEDASRHIPADLAGDIVPLRRGHGCVLVRVFSRELGVSIAQQRHDGFVRRVLPPDQLPLVPVLDIGPGHVVVACLHELALHGVLDVLDLDDALGVDLGRDQLRQVVQRRIGVLRSYGLEGFPGGVADLVRVERFALSRPFDNGFRHLHASLLRTAIISRRLRAKAPLTDILIPGAPKSKGTRY